MRKVILCILLIIILVSLSWFKEVIAQDLSQIQDNLSSSERELLKKYQNNQSYQSNPGYYQSQLIYDSSDNIKFPQAVGVTVVSR